MLGSLWSETSSVVDSPSVMGRWGAWLVGSLLFPMLLAGEEPVAAPDEAPDPVAPPGITVTLPVVADSAPEEVISDFIQVGGSWLAQGP